MPYPRPILARNAAAVIAFCAISTVCSQRACALDAVPQADLNAATRTLGFLDSLQHRTTISIGVVYNGSFRDAKDLASRAAADLSATAGPAAATIQASPVSVDDLAQGGRRFDVIYLMPGVAPSAGAIADYVRRQHVVSISNDPSCLNASCCVLMVQAGGAVNVVLDTALANAAGARFASVFTMMVKRK